MKPPPFGYAAPTTLTEAVGLLTEHAEAEARVLAGGQSLIPLMNFRLAKPGFLIDLRNVAGLSGIRQDGDVLVIGAMTRMAELERSPEVAVAAPLLAEAVGFVAHAPVRNSGTIGGSLAHADPLAELPAVATSSAS
jgi:carbon-monoxide dehydrogenase medium subunit